ncbi:hypothetical protein PsWM33_04030 [Pseudovibrio sp. WM33]|nr:hypothetical protein PsWM33_04030 [Pseudovibrio sp. WM33]
MTATRAIDAIHGSWKPGLQITNNDWLNTICEQSVYALDQHKKSKKDQGHAIVGLKLDFRT